MRRTRVHQQSVSQNNSEVLCGNNTYIFLNAKLINLPSTKCIFSIPQSHNPTLQWFISTFLIIQLIQQIDSDFSYSIGLKTYAEIFIDDEIPLTPFQ